MTTGAQNTDAILEWCERYRPDLVDGITKIIKDSNPAHILMMTSSFEAGRMYQTTTMAPGSYEPFDIEYHVPPERG